jgi:probable rRNA maturation factor
MRDLLGFERFELGIQLVTRARMASLNETFLHHAGPTDVITFDYRGCGSGENFLHGDIIICPAVAVVQAERFHTTWQSEVVRYVVHGLLHLLGYNDQDPPARGKMKREEGRLLAAIEKQFPLEKLARECQNPA